MLCGLPPGACRPRPCRPPRSGSGPTLPAGAEGEPWGSWRCVLPWKAPALGSCPQRGGDLYPQAPGPRSSAFYSQAWWSSLTVPSLPRWCSLVPVPCVCRALFLAHCHLINVSLSWIPFSGLFCDEGLILETLKGFQNGSPG